MPKPDDDNKDKDDILDDDDKKADDKKETDDDKKGDTFDLTIGGSTKSYTLEELKEAAQKAEGAEAKFEAAASARKEAERGVRIAELIDDIKKSDNPPQEKVEEFLKELGATEKELQAHRDSQKPTGDDKKGTEKPKLKIEDLPEEAQQILREAKSSNLTEIRNKIEMESKKAVDSDEILGKLILGVQEGPQRDEVKKVLHDMIVDDVRGRILGREAYGPDMLRSSVQKIRARTKVFGIPANAAGAGPVLPAELAAAVAVTPEIQEAEPIKRVTSTDAEYEENFLQRARQKMIKAAKGMGTSKRMM